MVFEAFATRCSRCQGHHLATLHFPRKIAAAALARGETAAEAALASRMPESIVSYWAQADTEFRALVKGCRLRQTRQSLRRVRDGVRSLTTEPLDDDRSNEAHS